MDVRRNFSKISRADRQRVIEAIKWMKVNERSGPSGATVSPSANGGVYQRYVLFHAQGGVEADLSDFSITLLPIMVGTFHSVVIDNEEWKSPATHPTTEGGLRDFLKEIPLSGSGPGDPGRGQTGGPFHIRSVDPPVPLPIVVGHIKNCPFADIKIRWTPSGSTTLSELMVARTPRAGPKFSLSTYQVAHRSPAFLPWHRVFLRLFEKDLQFADKRRGNDGKITLPYWNWLRDTDWDETSTASVWHKENFGGFTDTAGGTTTGDHFSPTSSWRLFDDTRALLTGAAGELRRRRTSERTDGPPPLAAGGVFPTMAVAQPVLRNAVFRVPRSQGFAGGLEHLLHDPVHGVVGGDGQMSDPLFSPQDPIFWLFHCFVDRLWSYWQWSFDKDPDNNPHYPQFGMLPGRRFNDSMAPWAVFGPSNPPYAFNVRVKDVLNAANFSSAVNSNDLLGKGYRYDSLRP